MRVVQSFTLRYISQYQMGVLGLYDCSDMREERPPDVADPSGPAISAVRMLLEHGANPNVRNNNGQTPLHEALDAEAPFPLWNVMRLLLIHGPDLTALGIEMEDHRIISHKWSRRECMGRGPLDPPLLEGHLKPKQLLLDHCASVHTQNIESQAPVHGTFANPEPDFTLMVSLPGRGTDACTEQRPVNWAVPCMETPTQYSLATGQSHCYWETMQQRMHKITTSGVCYSPHRATETKVLLEHGANVRFRHKGKRPYTLPRTMDPNSEVTISTSRILMGHGADVNAQDDDREDMDVLGLLLEYGAAVHLQHNEGETSFVPAGGEQGSAESLLGHWRNGRTMLSLTHEMSTALTCHGQKM
ncbi:ankyrin repeat-containing domain protein [Russula earlei]|uniref:Ankyrin repeat-containing domain protein n=1 Tax=Russula earlei TaxID=71964 RepID=A0ACC0U4I8_9AGAM|nr:ankyrin repeat-containing domain protein [Russula earlei]